MNHDYTADELIALLDLQPLEGEGGFFRQTYRQPDPTGTGSLTTAILFLVTPDSYSGLHRLTHDELFHFYLGDPCEMVTFRGAVDLEMTTLGSDLRTGMRVQHLVEAGQWQGTRLRPDGRFALLGTTMTPGFDPAGFELASEETLADLNETDRAIVQPYLPLMYT
ncbi:MAG: cupin domain-containing protein [Thermomicrobiales bacterium]